MSTILFGQCTAYKLVFAKAKKLFKEEQPLETISKEDTYNELYFLQNTLDKAFIWLKNTLGLYNTKDYSVSLVDPLITLEIQTAIQQGHTREYAINKVIEKQIRTFSKIESFFFQYQAYILKNVKDLLISIAFEKPFKSISEINKDCVLILDEVCQFDIPNFNKKYIKAVVIACPPNLEEVKYISAETDIPFFILNNKEDLSSIKDGESIAIDPYTNELHINISPQDSDLISSRSKRLDKINLQLDKTKVRCAKTIDHKSIFFTTSVRSNKELKSFLSEKDSSTGFFDIKFLYISQTWLPGQNEEYRLYKNLIKNPKPGQYIAIYPLNPETIKTHNLLWRSNKEPYVLPNFTGHMRSCTFLDNHFIAILRSALFEHIHILIGNIATFQEQITQINSYKEDLKNARIIINQKIKIGVCILKLNELEHLKKIIKQISFINIDVDEMLKDYMEKLQSTKNINQKDTNPLYHAYDAEFLQTIKDIIDFVDLHEIPLNIQGHLASSALYIPILIGINAIKFILNKSELSFIRRIISNIHYSQATKLANFALKSKNNITTYKKAVSLLESNDLIF